MGIIGAGRRYTCYPRLRRHTMTERPVLEPTTDHPIAITPTRGRVRVRVNGETVADTGAALSLKEATLPVVQYIPFGDVVQERLTRTDTSTYCPYKGEANYYSVTTAAGDTIDDVIWTYEQPYPAVAAIAGHVAFYPTKADISVESD
jgi:uncharacterized protein (DUF427 family)